MRDLHSAGGILFPYNWCKGTDEVLPTVSNTRRQRDGPHELPVLTEPKSNFLETILSTFPPRPLPDNFRFRLFGPVPFTPRPDEAESTFPSNSSNGPEGCDDGGLGSFEGWVGLGSAKKYG